MKKYISCKMVEAHPATHAEAYAEKKGTTLMSAANILEAMAIDPTEVGYALTYPDGYKSWCPKDEFERAYMECDGNPELKSKVSISQKMVDEFIAFTEVSTVGDKTTVVVATLRNGFTIVEASSCVDPANYSQEMGKEICMEKIKDKIWFLLGFLLQSAVNGLNN